MDKIEVALPVYDDEGNQVDTTTVELNEDQIADIVNTAVQVVYADRRRQAAMIELEDESLLETLDELDEALFSASAIEEHDYFPGQ
jgi:hypothetical protein